MGDVKRGVLVYDVPEDAPHLYARLRREICWKRAVAVNKSVYLIDWGARSAIQEIIKEAEKETGERAEISILPFDESAEPQLKEMAERAMLRMMGDVKRRLMKRLQDAKEKVNKDVSLDVNDKKNILMSRHRRVLRDVKRQLTDAEGLALVFGLTDEIRTAFESSKKSFEAELKSVLETKEVMRLEKKKLETAEKTKSSKKSDKAEDEGSGV